jgi:hypothetical protein
LAFLLVAVGMVEHLHYPPERPSESRWLNSAASHLGDLERAQ